MSPEQFIFTFTFIIAISILGVVAICIWKSLRAEKDRFIAAERDAYDPAIYGTCVSSHRPYQPTKMETLPGQQAYQRKWHQERAAESQPVRDDTVNNILLYHAISTATDSHRHDLAPSHQDAAPVHHHTESCHHDSHASTQPSYDSSSSSSYDSGSSDSGSSSSDSGSSSSSD